MATTFTHVGVIATDHEKSRRFYVEALDFAPTGVTLHANDGTFPGLPRLLEVDGANLLAEFLSNGQQTIELVSYFYPPPRGQPDRQPMNNLGLAHMCFLVEDVDRTAARFEKFGGTVLGHTRISHDQPDGIDRDYLMCTDPDGLRILLVKAAKLPGADAETQLSRRRDAD